MLLLVILSAYLFGSIPSGYILVKKKLNKDVRDFGSGNIGATNVKRVAGEKLSKITAICDMLKALFPVLLSDLLIKQGIILTERSLTLSLVALAAILGHNYTIFLKFKGGKGVATSAAAFMYILPIPFLITATVFFGLKQFTKIVSIRSLIAGITLFLSTLFLKYDTYLVLATFFTCALLFWRHRSNIKRIINGEEI